MSAGTLIRVGLYASIGTILASAGLTVTSWQLYAVMICVGLAVTTAKQEACK